MTEKGYDSNSSKEGPDWRQDHIELIDLLKVIWKFKYLVLAGTLVFALAATFFSPREQQSYIVQTTLKLNKVGMNRSAYAGTNHIAESTNQPTYIDLPKNIKSAIELGLLNGEIKNYLKESKNIGVSNLSKFNVLMLGAGDLMQISYRSHNAQLSVAILNSIEPVLTKNNANKIKAIQDNKYLDGLKIEQELNSLNAQIEVLQTNINNLSIRISELESEIDLLDRNLKAMIEQREEILKNSTKGGVLSGYLYDNTIQQNIALKNAYKKELFDYRTDRDYKKSELKKMESKLKIKQGEFKAFGSKRESIPFIQVVQKPDHNIRTITPKTKRKVLLVAAAGFLFMLFLSLFIDYFLKAIKKRGN